MRTTVRLPEPLLRQAKKVAAERGTTLTDLIADALRAALAHRHPADDAPPVRLPTYGAGGTLPGIDLSDSAALLDAMEEG